MNRGRYDLFTLLRLHCFINKKKTERQVNFTPTPKLCVKDLIRQFPRLAMKEVADLQNKMKMSLLRSAQAKINITFDKI